LLAITTKETGMLNDLERLRTNPRLRQLLAHYADLAQAGREIWQDRLMTVDGVDVAEISRLHGQLIAFDWIEQNTGQFSVLRQGAVTGCYRVTPAGLRAMRLAQRVQTDEESEEVVVESGQAEMLQPAAGSVAATVGDTEAHASIAADTAEGTKPNADAQAA
jgi:hypothetical protein